MPPVPPPVSLPVPPLTSVSTFPNSSVNTTLQQSYRASSALNFEELQRATPIAPALQPADSSVPSAPFRNPFVPPPVLYNQSIPPIYRNPPADSLHSSANASSQALPVPKSHQNLLPGNSFRTPPSSAVTPIPTPQSVSLPQTNSGAEVELQKALLLEKKKSAAEKRRQTLLKKAEEKKRLARERSIKAAATRKKNREEAERQKAEEEERRKELLRMELESCEPLSPDGSNIRIGDRVFGRPANNFQPERAEIVEIGDKHVYVHFLERDRRLDKWLAFHEVTKVPANLQENGTSSHIKLTRAKSRQMQERNPVSEREVGNEAIARAEAEREKLTAVKNVGKIVFGMCMLEAWYWSPFPNVEKGKTIPYVFMCEHCMKYTYNSRSYLSHRKQCDWKNPPGAKIYDDPANRLAVYEVDGMVNMAYCQRLTLLGKLFLDHKTLFFDVAPFLFYIVTLNGEVAGFFSKERPERRSEFNLACLLTLPQHQKKGIGRFLISLSFEIGRLEGGKARSPERPLSDLGQVSYKSFWSYEVLRYGERRRTEGEMDVPVEVVSKDTGIREFDVTETIKRHKVFKMWKGTYSLDLSNSSVLDEALAQLREPRLPLKPELLKYFVRMRDSRAPPTTPKSPGPSHARDKSRRNSSSGKKRGRPKLRNSASPARPPSNGSMRTISNNTSNPARSSSQIPVSTPKTSRTSKTPFQTPSRIRRTSTLSGTPRNGRSERGPTDYIDAAMKHFCESNTPEKVLAPPDSEEGLPTTAYAAFAKNMGIRSPSKARNDLFKAAQQFILKQYRPTGSRINSSSSGEERARKAPKMNGSTPPRSSIGGGKDIGHIMRVIASASDIDEAPPKRNSPKRGGGLARGRMVSGFTGLSTEEPEEENTDMNDEPDDNEMDTTIRSTKNTERDTIMRDVDSTRESTQDILKPAQSITEVEEVVSLVDSAVQKAQPKLLSRTELNLETEDRKPIPKISKAQVRTKVSTNPENNMEVITILDTDDEA